MQTYVGFIDVGFLRAAGAAVLGQRAASVNPNSNAVANWFRSIGATPQLSGQTLLRAYWYDGAFDPAHPNYAGQRTFFNAIARTPGIQLRLGQIAERPNRLEDPIKQALANTAQDLGMEPSQLLAAFSQRWTFRPERQQKGVDTLIALDMVRLASRSAYTTILPQRLSPATATLPKQSEPRRISECVCCWHPPASKAWLKKLPSLPMT